MGSPLITVLADFLLIEFENNYLRKFNFQPDFIFRYIDDFIISWSHSPLIFNDFLSFINNFHNNIKFTVEFEHNNVIPFLDILVLHNDNQLNFSVYRKETADPCYIPFSSNHPISHKLSALEFSINRAFKYCSNYFLLKEELDYIKKCFNTFGYDNKLINRMINQKNPTFNSNLEIQNAQNSNKFISFPYINNFNSLFKNIQKNFNFRFAFKPAPNIAERLKTDRLNNLNRNIAGVYKIPLVNNADNNDIKIYIGKTKRNLAQRIKEHKYNLRINNLNSELVKFLTENNNYTPHWDEAEIFAKTNSDFKLEIIESIQILKNKDSAINNRFSREIPFIWKNFL